MNVLNTISYFICNTFYYIALFPLLTKLWERKCFKSGSFWPSFSDFHAVQFFAKPVNQGCGCDTKTVPLDQDSLKSNLLYIFSKKNIVLYFRNDLKETALLFHYFY
jgi:hypothetical protein